MKIITSATNNIVSSDSKLKDRKYRKESKEFLLEGKKLIREAISGGYVLSRLYFVKGVEVDDITAEDYIEVSDNVINKLSDAKTSQGIIAVAKEKEGKIENSDKLSLILENIQDPKNVGALIRSAAACGFIDVYSINSADAFSMKAIRASMGGIFKVNVFEYDLNETLNKLCGSVIIVADMNGENLFFAKLPTKNIAVAVANEGQGVTDELLNKANKIVSIPMKNDVESLNVAVSGSILMYNIIKEE